MTDDVIYSLAVLIEKLAFFKKMLQEFIKSLSTKLLQIISILTLILK